MRELVSWLVLLCGVVGCKDDGAPAVDVRVVDRRGFERGPADRGVGEQRRDGPTGDRGRDGPRPAPHWTSIAGALDGEGHTLTVLQNGDVLVAGGQRYTATGATYLAGALRYVAAQGVFVPAGQLAAARTRHTATLLPDGRVLVVGGWGATADLGTAELYDPAAPAATAWSAAPSAPQPLAQHTATTLGSGQILIAGGDSPQGNDSTAALHTYDPSSATWKTVLSTLKQARRQHTATLLKGGKILFAGGAVGKLDILLQTYLDSLEVYDPASGVGTLLTPTMSKKRVGHTATLLDNGRVLIVGGVCRHSCGANPPLNDVYDPGNDTLLAITHPATLPWGHVAVKLLDGRALIVGSSEPKELARVFAFEPTGWMPLPDLPEGRAWAEGVRLGDGSVLVVGGSTTIEQTVYTTTALRLLDP